MTRAFPPPDLESKALVGDIGGTNCRFAIATPSPSDAWDIAELRSYRCDDFTTFEQALATYLATISVPLSGAAIAVAGPVAEGSVSMTNRPWRISEQGVAEMLGVSRCRILNDFEALAYALPALGPDQVRPLGPVVPPPPRSTLAVLGAGTGLGVSAWVRGAASEAVLVSECGHIAFAPQDGLEVEIWRRLALRHQGHAAVEHALSGSGLVSLHRALCDIAGARVKFETAPAITAAVAKGDTEAVEVAELFARIFGSVAGDIALAFGARGGVFVAGGVSQRLLSSRTEEAFRTRFEDKGEFSPYVAAIPTRMIVHPQPGILGAACALAELVS
jgi:glucokinase